MRFLTSLKCGLLQALGQGKMVVTLWAVRFVLALLIAFPILRWLGQAFDRRPEADVVLHGFSLEILSTLLQQNGERVLTVLGGLILAGLVISLLLDTFFAGGILSVLGARREGTFLLRFFEGSGYFFGRFFRLALIGGLTTLLVTGALAGGLTKLADLLGAETASDRTLFYFHLARLGICLLVVLYFSLVLDYSRVRVVLQDRRDMFRVFRRSLVFVLSSLGSTFAILFSFGVLIFFLFAFFLFVDTHLPGTSWKFIMAGILLQQVVMLVRSGLKVGLVGAELAYFRELNPTLYSRWIRPYEPLAGPRPGEPGTEGEVVPGPEHPSLPFPNASGHL